MGRAWISWGRVGALQAANQPGRFLEHKTNYQQLGESERVVSEPDDVDERARPRVASAAVMSEHAARYAFALGLVGNRHVLDLGCGAGYGTEMLSWTAASVRGFDLWIPDSTEQIAWPHGREFFYGHDLCASRLPEADAAIMFEVLEHLSDAAGALEHVFHSVQSLICSFPNPDYHGSTSNQYHVNDWPLPRLERELRSAARRSGRTDPTLTHLHQRPGEALIRPGRNAYAAYWLVVADTSAHPIIKTPERKPPLWRLRQRVRLRSRLGLR